MLGTQVNSCPLSGPSTARPASVQRVPVSLSLNGAVSGDTSSALKVSLRSLSFALKATALRVGSYQNTATGTPPRSSVKQARSPAPSRRKALVWSPVSTPSTFARGSRRESTLPIASFASPLICDGNSDRGYFLPSNKL